MEYDYVIVGAGSAGCVLAYRLSENPDNQVLLIEAGGEDTHPFIHMPKGLIKAMADPNLIWPYAIEPGTHNGEEIWARGRTLGGSSSINGLVYVRGQDADYDAMGAVTSDDWNWDSIGKAYKEMENHELGAGKTRGDKGPLRISMPDIKTTFTRAAIKAGVAMGLTEEADVNEAGDTARIGYQPRTIFKGKRQSAAVAFLHPIRHSRPNLTVVTHVVVDKVLFEGKRAVAVTGKQGGKAVTYRAKRDIIISAGALSSPGILQRSGVGPAAHLKSLGIPVVADRAEVGANVREHRALVMQWRIKDNISQNREYRGLRLIWNVLRYYLTHKGPMSAGSYELGAWFKSRKDLNRPDGQILIAPFSYDYTNPKGGVEAHGGMNLCLYALRPDSSGTYLIRSTDPLDHGKITSNYSVDETDRKRAVDLIRFTREYATREPLGQYVVEETRPGPQYQTDEEILQAYKEMGYGAYHASGTCRMGKDENSVIDPRARVRGVEGLRVVDTSIFPMILAGNTNGPAMVTAWRAADLILADRT